MSTPIRPATITAAEALANCWGNRDEFDFIDCECPLTVDQSALEAALSVLVPERLYTADEVRAWLRKMAVERDQAIGAPGTMGALRIAGIVGAELRAAADAFGKDGGQ
jgi:hypothetical protein